ncbi:Uncharacterised protein [Mycobacteroides abscessus subsp. abscessus]|nr:Uncharacterised protein [Mycobacteroides abscessus subsp. abscessus]
MVVVRDLQGDVTVAVLLGESVDLVVKDIGQALEEEQWEQIVLELRRVLLASASARPLIFASWALCGLLEPPSHLFTVANETPRRSASSAWVRSSAARMVWRSAGMVGDSVMYVMFA